MFAVIGGIAWLAAFFGVGLSMVRAELRYFGLYRDVKHDPFRLPHEIGPWGVFRPDRSKEELWAMVWEAQPEPELEAARLRVTRLWKLTGAILFAGPLVVIPLTYL